VVRELAQKETVDLWYPKTDDPLSTEVPSVAFRDASEVDSEKLATYDLLVYNLGNHLPFHRAIYEVSRRFPGLCVMHDFVMHHFFAAYYLEHLRRPEAYVAAMKRCAGARGAVVAEEILVGKRPRVWETDEVSQYPLFDEAIRGQYGVVTHSDFFRQRVESVSPAPTVRLYLPYELTPIKFVVSREQMGIPDFRLLIVTIGHINPNKRVAAVLDALAESHDLLERIFYIVAGPCDPGFLAELKSRIAKLGLEQAVRLTGYVEDEQLQSLLNHADLCINLRFPATEGASASLVEEMLHGKAVVVTNTGFYSELPDDCVAKIRPQHEHADLAAVLRLLITDAGRREKMGRAAREFAENHFRADRYADHLIEFAWQMRGAKPLLQLADLVGQELQFMGVTKDMPIVETVSRECVHMFVSGQEP
jgi:glycosyltransferase involved in cell wall biosynthesis